jgi:hypothetical protein
VLVLLCAVAADESLVTTQAGLVRGEVFSAYRSFRVGTLCPPFT